MRERPLNKEFFLYKNRLPLTYKCNDNCIFCYDGATRKTVPDLALKEAKRLVVKLKSEGQNLISFG